MNKSPAIFFPSQGRHVLESACMHAAKTRRGRRILVGRSRGDRIRDSNHSMSISSFDRNPPMPGNCTNRSRFRSSKGANPLPFSSTKPRASKTAKKVAFLEAFQWKVAKKIRGFWVLETKLRSYPIRYAGRGDRTWRKR